MDQFLTTFLGGYRKDLVDERLRDLVGQIEALRREAKAAGEREERLKEQLAEALERAQSLEAEKARGGEAGVLKQIVAPQHNGDDVRLLTADHLGKRFNVPTVPGDGSSILSRVENVPALCLKQGSPPDAFRVSPAKAGPGIVPIGIGIPIA